MLQVKDYNFTDGDLVQRKFGGYQITYKMTTAQKNSFKTFLGEDGKEELEVDKWLKDNSIQVVNQPNTLSQDKETDGAFESVITEPGQSPLIKEKGKDPVPTVVDARGTPGYDPEEIANAEVFSNEGTIADNTIENKE